MISRRTFLILTAAAATGCRRDSADSESTGPVRSHAVGPAGPKLDTQPPIPEGWGHVRGRFVYDGEPPVRKQLEITADKDYCGQYKLLDESLIVSPENHGIADIAVMRYARRGALEGAVHPSYEKEAEDKIVLNNFQTRYRPHVLPILTSQALVVENQDPIADNVKIAAESNTPVNHNLAPSGGRAEFRFPNAERLPVHVTCALHNWESSWLIVRDDPYVAITDEDGSFEIRNLPAGQQTFVAWQERPTYIRNVTIDGRPREWQRGRFTLDIKPDETLDLGEIHVSPGVFR